MIMITMIISIALNSISGWLDEEKTGDEEEMMMWVKERLEQVKNWMKSVFFFPPSLTLSSSSFPSVSKERKNEGGTTREIEA